MRAFGQAREPTVPFCVLLPHPQQENSRRQLARKEGMVGGREQVCPSPSVDQGVEDRQEVRIEQGLRQV